MYSVIEKIKIALKGEKPAIFNKYNLINFIIIIIINKIYNIKMFIYNY